MPEHTKKCTRPFLPSGEHTRCLHLARTNAKALVRRAQLTGGPIAWEPTSSHNNVHVFAGIDGSAPPTVASVCGRVVVEATLTEMAELFRTDDTSASYRRMSGRFCGDGDLIEAEHVQTLQPTDGRSMASIKWTAHRVACGVSILQPRDFVFVEHQHDMTYKDRKGWVRSLTSIQGIAAPNTTVYVRGNLHGVAFVCLQVPTETTKIEVLQLVQWDLKGNAPHWLTRVAGAKCIQHGLGQLDRRLTEARLRPSLLHLPRLSLPPLTHARHCHMCGWRKEHCRVCGDSVCDHDSTLWEVDVEAGLHVHTRLCHGCVNDCLKGASSSSNQMHEEPTSPPSYLRASRTFGGLSPTHKAVKRGRQHATPKTKTTTTQDGELSRCRQYVLL
ncbi:Aste57867_595 [Aphanomyces stellatus]|uniref:Aste57867_595 protein n=1 Tax=Aphanomyces stellatus TaxID=120398 RepID=A0A485K301_9STRA|nr:hypothetical protein As57867_000594 [Aphanomyces stellatus]VFT77820.1 Aste57867_595 [Aphanomyces stellatus]